MFRKNTHSLFLLYLREKCLDLHKIFRVCLWGINYSTDIKIKYSLLPVTSFWRHVYMFVNIGFRGITVEDTHLLIKCLFASQQQRWIFNFDFDGMPNSSQKNTLKILCKLKHFQPRYKRKREWVVFFWTQCRMQIDWRQTWRERCYYIEYMQTNTDGRRGFLRPNCRGSRQLHRRTDSGWYMPPSLSTARFRSDTLLQLQRNQRKHSSTSNSTSIGGVVVRTSGLWSRGRQFDSRPFHCRVA